MTSPLVIGLATGLTVGSGLEKARSNSRRAKAASVHSAGVWAGSPGAVPEAIGLRTASTTLETISATVLTGVVTAAAVAVAAGRGESLTSGAMSIVAAVGTGVVAAADTMGRVGVCTASATTRVASTLLADALVRAACVFAAAALRVVFAAVVPDLAGAVVCCAAGAVASVESGSDPAAAVVAAVPADREEPAGESVSALSVLTTAPGSAERVAGCDDPDEVSDADFDVT
jgi:hypothetical protein